MQIFENNHPIFFEFLNTKFYVLIEIQPLYCVLIPISRGFLRTSSLFLCSIVNISSVAFILELYLILDSIPQLCQTQCSSL